MHASTHEKGGAREGGCERKGVLLERGPCTRTPRCAQRGSAARGDGTVASIREGDRMRALVRAVVGGAWAARGGGARARRVRAVVPDDWGAQRHRARAGREAVAVRVWCVCGARTV